MNPGTIFTTAIKYNEKKKISERNHDIVNFFHSCGFNVRLVGNAINPAVIYENNSGLADLSLSLSVSFKGDMMILKKDQVKGSDEFATIPLVSYTEKEKQLVANFVNNGMHKTIFKIYMRCDAVPTNKLYLGHYKHTDKSISPVFTAESDKSAVFFSKESRDFIHNKLTSNHYNCLTE